MEKTNRQLHMQTARNERNNELWPMDVAYSIYEREPLPTYDENVEYYRDWLRRRNEFLIDYFGY